MSKKGLLLIISFLLIIPSLALALSERYNNIKEAYSSDCIWILEGVSNTYTCISKINELVEPQTLSLAAPHMALLINGQDYIREVSISGEFWNTEKTPYQLYVGYDYNEDGEPDYIEIKEFYSKYFGANIEPTEPVRKIIIFGDVKIDWGEVYFENNEKYLSKGEWLGYVDGWVIEESSTNNKYYLLEIPIKVENLDKFVQNGLIEVNSTSYYYLKNFNRESYPISRDRWKKCVNGCIAVSSDQPYIVYLYVPVTELIKGDTSFSDKIWFSIHIKDTVNAIVPVSFTHYLTLKNSNEERPVIVEGSAPIELVGDISGILLIDKERTKTYYIIDIPIRILSDNFYSEFNDIKFEVNRKEFYLRNLNFCSNLDWEQCLNGCIITETNSLWHALLNIGEEDEIVGFSIQKVDLTIEGKDNKVLVRYTGDIKFEKQISLNADYKKDAEANISTKATNIDSLILLDLLLKLEKIKISLISIKKNMESIAFYYRDTPEENCWRKAINNIDNAIAIIRNIKDKIRNKDIKNTIEVKEHLLQIKQELEQAVNNILYCS